MYSSEKNSLKLTFATFASSLIPRANGWHSILPGLSASGFEKKSSLYHFLKKIVHWPSGSLRKDQAFWVAF